MDGSTPVPPAEGFPIPLSQLKRPAPTPRVGGAYVTFFFGIFWLIGTLVLPLLSLKTFYINRYKYVELKRDGQRVKARIVQFKRIAQDEGNTYEACYQYNVVDPGPGAASVSDRALEACESSSSNDLASLREGDEVDVVYAKKSPRLASLAQRLRPPAGFEVVFGFTIGCLFSLVGVLLITRNYQRIRNHALLRKHGELASGVLFDRWHDNGEDSRADFVAFAFLVPTRGGSPDLFTSAQRSKAAYSALTVGQRTTVRYLPEDPRVCELVDYPWQLADGLE